MSGNGSTVTRAELAAQIRRIDDNLLGIREDIADIRARIAIPGRWINARLTRVLDQALPSILVGAIVFFVAHYKS